jgi:hypothetical protein
MSRLAKKPLIRRKNQPSPRKKLPHLIIPPQQKSHPRQKNHPQLSILLRRKKLPRRRQRKPGCLAEG